MRDTSRSRGPGRRSPLDSSTAELEPLAAKQAGVFLLTSDLSGWGPAAQLGLLAAALPGDRSRAAVGVLGRADGPAADRLRAAGVAVHSLPIRHLFDLNGVRRLRQAVAECRAGVVHAWGPEAVAASRLVTADLPGRPRLVASAAADGHGVGGWLAGRQLKRADRVVAQSSAEAERLQHAGVTAENVVVIRPGVSPPGPPPDGPAFRKSLELPPTARLIVAAGRFEPGGGLDEAVWAFDVLKYDAPDLFLVLVGEGPERRRVERFGKALGYDDYRIRFAGERTDLADLLPLAEVVWVTDPRGGVGLALDAMAAGRPVVGWRTPDLAAVVSDGETGLLAPPGDRVRLAARTRALFDDPALGNRLGEAGRVRAAERHAVGPMADRYAALYAELSGGS